jgi:DNA polymerase-1
MPVKLVTNKVYLDCKYELATLQDVVDYFQDKKYIAVDTETNGVDWNSKKIIMLQLGDGDTQFVVDTRDMDISVLYPLFRDETKTKILHNAKFDYKFILATFGVRLRGIYDTMLAEVVLNCGKRKYGYGLDKVSKRYLNIEMAKDVRGEFSKIADGDPYTCMQIEYGAKDVEHLVDIMNIQMINIKKYGLEEVLKLENNALRAFSEIEYYGLKFDKESWLKLAVEAESISSTKERELDEMLLTDPKLASFKLNAVQLDMFGAEPKETSVMWSSPSQVARVLQALDPSIEDTSMREMYKRQNQYPLIKTLIDFRKQAKLKTTYGRQFINHLNKYSGRVHTTFWQILNTGRVSSGMKGKRAYQNYPNMQNIPADNRYRNCFGAEDGWKLVTMDYSGQELRLIAEGSKDPVWLQAFANGEDVHGKVAALVFDIDISEARDKPEFLRGKSYRDVAKTINFGLAYGMSHFKLADTLSIPEAQAKDFINKYFEALPNIEKFLNLLGMYGKNNGFIRTFRPFRRIRWFEDWSDLSSMDNAHRFQRLGEIERASKNTPIQGSGADMIKLALSMIIDHIDDCNLHDKVRIVSQVHDEITCEVRDDYVDEWCEVQETIMKLAGKRICKNVDMVVDGTVTQQWCK